MAAEILSITELVVEYPDSTGRWRPVVDGLSLAVRRGERVGVVGESGSGKSVAALAVLGLVVEPGRITGGAVTVGRIDVGSASEQQLRKIRGGTVGLVFQEPSAAANPVLTVGFQIAEAVRAHRDCTRLEAEAEARSLLDEVALDREGDLFRAYPHQLSGGQLQRAMIAIALAGRPRLLIADEPTTALDLTTQAQILALLRRLTSDGTSLLLISHDLAVVAGLVDRVVVVHAGREVEVAPADRIFRRPLHPYTRKLLDAGGGDGATPGTAERTPIGTGSACSYVSSCPLAEPSCQTEVPPMQPIDDGAAVRCPVVRRSEPESGL
jgi:oligopeptide/dipeptide ABC transporter ATP-binding protein